MKVLVTGATGFIGNYVVQEIINKGFHVIATSINREKAKRYEWFSKVQYIDHDLNEHHDNYFKFFHEPNILIHLSWEGLPNYKDFFHFERNLFSNYFFLKSMIEHGLENCVVAGTCLEYGMRSGFLHEDMDTKPVTSYGLAKDTLRRFLEQLQYKYKFDLKWLRLFYIYGPGQGSSSILSQLERSLENQKKVFNMSGGEQLRDYLPVRKVAEYIVEVAIQDRITGVINCCSGSPVSIRRLVEDYLKHRKQTIELNVGYYPYSDYEPMAFWGNAVKLKKAVGETE
ncbi:MAG: NAD(P)-dependent oxidoreductase [Deltaproteobacteria bacterium]|nr:NAD(P)-dependent oxidoreductase [Deltaproteobacteria bacterium]